MIRPRAAAALLVLSTALAGCGTVNEKLAAGAGDVLPQWAGGLPPNAPPRPGTPEYDAWMHERERRRAMPAEERKALERAEREQAAAPR